MSRIDVDRLCEILGVVNHRDLEALARLEYRRITIRKPRGGTRRVFQPAAELRRAQRKLLAFLSGVATVHEAATGRKGQAVNARRHVGAKAVLCVDIVNFFDNIPRARVVRALEPYCTPDTARWIAALTTHRRRRRAVPTLVQGAPTSVLLADLVCRELDVALSGCASVVYTRYIDDITLSAAARAQLPLLVFVDAVLRRFGFARNVSKTHVLAGHKPIVITGMVIQPGSAKVRAPFELWARLRNGVRRLRNVNVYDRDRAWQTAHTQLSGLAAFLKTTDAQRVEPLQQALQAMRENDDG